MIPALLQLRKFRLKNMSNLPKATKLICAKVGFQKDVCLEANARLCLGAERERLNFSEMHKLESECLSEQLFRKPSDTQALMDDAVTARFCTW